MHRVQELVRLHRQGVSERDLCRQLQMGRNTARRYGAVLRAAGLLDGAPEVLPPLDELRRVVELQLPSKAAAQATSSVERWRTRIEGMVVEGATAKVVYDCLRLDVDGFMGSYDAVKRMCRRLRAKRAVQAGDVAIRVETAPGQIAQVDFFYVGKLLDPATRKERKCWAFVMVLAHSRHMFIDLVFDQTVETWVRLHEAAFRYFGGVPAVVVPDNLKAAVIRAAFDTSGEVALNLSFVALARHYGFQIDPTPPYQPNKKGKVERAGQYFRRSYMRPRTFQDVHDARAGIVAWIEEIAGLRVHGTTGRRPLEVFERDERAQLRALPVRVFDPVVWHEAKVHIDSFIQFRGHFYSVPFHLIGRRVWVQASATTVAIYADDARVATHRRGAPGGRSRQEGHLPSVRDQWRFQDRAYWEEQAAALGDDVLTYVAKLLEADDVLLQLRKVQAVVSFLRNYPPERRAAACRRASFYSVTSVRAFQDILRKDLDVEPLPESLVHGALPAPRFARRPDTFAHHPTLEA